MGRSRFLLISEKGIGLKKLEKTFWEIRVNIHLKIIFEWQEDLIKFLLVGSHDEINRFLNTPPHEQIPHKVNKNNASK